MLTKTRVITIILFLAILGLFVYAYPIIKNRYFSGSQPAKKIININNNSGADQNNSNAPDQSNAPLSSDESSALEKSLTGEKPAETNESSPLLNINERGTTEAETLAHITTEHCDNNCQAFAMDFKLLEYCHQVCGIAPLKEVSGCDDKNNLEKDYCLKDLAITKKDSALCESINDANIKQTCQNRIMEDILESQAN